MTWRIANVGVSNTTPAPTGGTWRLANVSVSTGISATWRVAAVSVSINPAPPTTWRLAKVSVAIVGGWRIANIGVTVAQTAVPAVAPLSNATVDPVAPYSVTATVTNGVTPTSWTWHLGTTPVGSDLDSLLTVAGSTVTFPPPGSATGGNVYLTVTATANGQTSASQTATITVNPADHYYSAGGILKAMSATYYKKG